MFTDVKTVSELLIKHVEKINGLKSVGFTAVTDEKQLLQYAKTLAGSPKAVICMGGGQFEKYGMSRKFRVGIVLLVPFQLHQAIEALTLLDATISSFAYPLTLGGKIDVILTGWAPLETDAQTLAFALEIELTEPY